MVHLVEHGNDGDEDGVDTRKRKKVVASALHVDALCSSLIGQSHGMMLVGDGIGNARILKHSNNRQWCL